MLRNKRSKRSYGDAGEMLARVYLRLHGARVIARNFTCPFGEIDIIAKYEGHICFIEVKRRASHAYGSPAQAVDARKRRHIVKCAAWFLMSRNWQDKPARFDVAEIDGYKITYIRGAFNADV